MPQHLLDKAAVGSVLQHQGGTGTAQQVAGASFLFREYLEPFLEGRAKNDNYRGLQGRDHDLKEAE